MAQKIATRKTPADNLNYRSMSIRTESDGRPATLDEDGRSVEVIGATETPVEVFDFERWEIIPEILLMNGCEMPGSRQVPLLDTHKRFEGAASVLGSYRDMRSEGEQLVGRVHFSSVPEAESPFIKLREGHLTDFSVGYRPVKSTWVPDGEKAVIGGRSFEGPVKVVTRWRVKELSICPIGADELAKARAEHQPTPTPVVARNEEKKKMNELLRKWLEKRGLDAGATEDQAWEFYVRHLENLKPGEDRPPVPDIAKERAEAARMERERITEIRAMTEKNGCAEIAQRLIDEGATLDQARKAVLIAIENREQPRVPPVTVVVDERDKFRAAAEHGLIMRAGGVLPENLAPGARDLAGYSLRELAREVLRIGGHPTGGSPMELMGRALGTADFPLILANVANKSLFEGWEQAEETWATWCGVGSVSDFKTHYLPRASEMDDLDEIPDKIPYKYGDRRESEEQYAIATYGKLFALTRQALINDDLSAFTDTPRAMGESAARKVGDLPYAVLTANAAMGDGVVLFHANHSNLVAAGAGAAPGTVTIAAGIRAMGIQTDQRGLRRLNIRPQFFLAPKALEGVSEVFFRSENFSDHQLVPVESGFASTRANPYSGSYFTRVYEARLDSNSTTAWFLAAMKNKTVRVFFLNGQQRPYLETKQGWTVDGVEYKVRIDAGAKAVDWRGLYNNAGV